MPTSIADSKSTFEITRVIFDSIDDIISKVFRMTLVLVF